MFVGETHFGAGCPASVSDACQQTPAGTLPDPGGEYPLRADEQASLLEDLAHGSLAEVFARHQAASGRLPGFGDRALEQKHASIRENREDAGDEICLHAPSLPGRSTSKM